MLALLSFALPLTMGAVTFDDWIATFPSIPVDQRGPADDPDGDGIPSFVEYFIDGMDPSSPDAHLLPEPALVGGNLVYSVPKRAGLTEPNLMAVIEVFNAASSSWEVNTANVTEDADSITLTLPITHGAHLVRLKVDTEAPPATNNPIALAYPVEYASGEYAWTDELKWDVVFNVMDFGAVADGVPDFTDDDGMILFNSSSDPERPDYFIPGNLPRSWGTDNHAAFTAAIAAAHDAGGGVVFVPAGSYYIADHLYLRDGVVIMGAQPAPGEDNALDASFNPPSKLLFPRYAPFPAANGGNGNPVRGNGPHAGFKRIFTENPLTASNLGLVWLDINRAAIIIDTPSRSPIVDGGNWSGKPAGIRAALQGTNRVVFGIRSNNTAIAEGSDGANFGVPYTGDGQLRWQRWTYRFNANIRIGGAGNALVANCRLNDLSAMNDFRWGKPGEIGPATYYDDSFEQIGFKARGTSGSTMYDLNTVGQAAFLYSNQYGISVNGLFYFSEAGNAADGAVPDPDGNPNKFFGTPTSAPHLFHPGNVIRDSFIFSTLGGKAEISGQGMKFLDNVFADVPDKWAFLMSTGRQQPSGSSFMSRGMLFGGYDAVVSGNHVRTYKHRIGSVVTGGDGGYYVNDGEGIMIDNTTTRVNGLTITNNNTNASIFAYRTRETRNVHIADNVFEGVTGSSNSGGLLLLSNDANVTNYGFQNILIENNVMRGQNIRVTGSEVMNRNPNVNDLTPTADILIRNNVAPDETRSIIYSEVFDDAVTLEDNTNFNIIPSENQW